LEAASDLRIDYIHVTPNIDRGLASVEVVLNRVPDREVTLALEVKLEEKKIRKVTATTVNLNVTIIVDMDTRETFHPVALWSTSYPALYDLRVQLLDGDRQLDQVDTYFGMRKIEVRDGVVYLNNKRIYQRLVLDQGYWPDTMITPPSDEAIREDLEWTKKFGFNGARKHQKN
jgi:beta-galactosidase/beta-glucuronidase